MKSKALRIGLIGSGDDSSSKLLRLLAEQGMQVVHALLPKDLTEAHIAATDLDVWLLDLDDSHWHDQLDELMDRSSVPIFFNEHQAIESQQHLDYWCRNLISRMFELVADVPGLPTATATATPAAAASRSGDTLHIAFPAANQKKAESKPSDELTPAPAALDPDLLQEIEELEQLLQTPEKQQEVLLDLDDSLPLPSAQDDFIFTPAAPANKPVAAAPAPAPAAEKSADKPAEKTGEQATTAATAVSDAPSKPHDPVAAAKERAAKIKQQVAANQASSASAKPTEAVSAKPTEPVATAKPITSEPTPAADTTRAAVAAPTVATKSAAAPEAPAPVAATASAISAANASAASAQAKPAAAPPIATVPEKTAGPDSATPASAATTAPVKPTTESPSGAGLSLDIAALEPVIPPPAKHDWPSFPAPELGPATPLANESDTADFAPIQPQPAAGPMREPVRPLAVVPTTAAPASAKPAAGKAEAEPAPALADSKNPPAVAFAEPVPTLTPASMADLEFEAVEFDGADELEPHGDFDVPMLESVASANASEFEAVTDLPPALPCDLWVLGASLGGPAALKRFFTALDQPLPICFLLAQHIDAHFLPVLGKILEQANPFYAVQVLARPGLIEPGSLLLAPIEKRLRFLDAGQIVHSGKSWTPPYSPCIDDVLSDVAAAYPGQVHAIVFSGMGEDGVDGARAIRDGQGQIWVQEAESCASSVMPDAIHQAGLAQQRATPEQLASRLMARYRQSADSKNLA